jgi:predicted SAM-dependent methyltransferase
MTGPSYSEDYFIFDFTERTWPIPDSSVDYIYSEDFIEHIPQKNQLAFLAESLRVLKTDCYNRVSTPCLYESMRTHSEFSKGLAGLYVGEFDKWGHICLFTQRSMEEIAHMIGYRRALFTAKSHGTSCHAVADSRPGDQLLGNIWADLLK